MGSTKMAVLAAVAFLGACGGAPGESVGASEGQAATSGSCYSSTLAQTVPLNTCVETSSSAWYQCDEGNWVDRWNDPAACSAVYAYGQHPPSGSNDAGLTQDAAPAPSGNGCPALTYPSGVVIQTFPDAAMTATYSDHLGAGESAPKCFLDVTNLLNPTTQEVYPITVNVSTHFQLQELVGTEVEQGYGNIVLMSPSAVQSLEAFAETLGVPVSVNSGFRSPRHQEDVCNSLCGDPLGCSGTCANNSRHMFGDAFDLPMSFYTTPDERVACSSGFKFAYLESGTHLHIDQNPIYASCVLE
jgi:hypothetical protein